MLRSLVGEATRAEKEEEVALPLLQFVQRAELPATTIKRGPTSETTGGRFRYRARFITGPTARRVAFQMFTAAPG